LFDAEFRRFCCKEGLRLWLDNGLARGSAKACTWPRHVATRRLVPDRCGQVSSPPEPYGERLTWWRRAYAWTTGSAL